MRLGQIVGGLGESHGATDYPRVAHLYRQIFCPRIGRHTMSNESSCPECKAASDENCAVGCAAKYYRCILACLAGSE